MVFKDSLRLRGAASVKMKVGLVLFLSLSCSNGALGAAQDSPVSQGCMRDTNTFLLEVNQGHPKEYAVRSKYQQQIKPIA